MNAKVGLDLYRLKVPINNGMVVGFDVTNEGRRSILGFTASYSKHFTQFYSKVEYQELHGDLIS